MKIPDSVAYRAFTLAQALAPFDTGNLKFNAMDLLITSNGFEIKYDSNFANYIQFLEEGKSGGGNSNKNKDFIKSKTRGSVARYLEQALNGNITLATRHHRIVTKQSGEQTERREYREADSIADNNYRGRYF